MDLSHTKIVNAKPRAEAYKIFDGQGLYVEVLPSGTKSFRIKFRMDGKESRLVIGTFPSVSLQQAREKLLEAKKQIAQGINPAIAKKVAKATRATASANSFKAVALEYLDKHKSRWTEKYLILLSNRLKYYAFPHIGTLPISEVDAPNVLVALRKLEQSDKLTTANRVKQAIGIVMRYAIATGRAKYDPIPSLKGAIATRSTKHHASVTEPKKVGEILRMFDAFHGTKSVEVALDIAPKVFTRPGELRKMKWNDLDLDAGIWSIPSGNMKMRRNHLVPLSRQVVQKIREIQPVTGDGDYVFPCARDPKRPMSDGAINAALRRLGIDTKEVLTGHGFRAMARTILRERLKFDTEVIECQLSHAKKGSLGEAYDRALHLDERRRMMQSWADYLDDLKQGGKVVRLPIAG